MFQAAQMPFLTCLVFSVGLGVGFAWKSGWIPIELAATPTGQILNEPGSLPADSAVMDPARPLQWAAFAEQSSVDPVVFEQQTEPVEEISSNESAGSQEPKRLRNPATRRLPDTSETDRSSIPQQLSLESSVPDPSKVRVDPEFAVEAIQAEGSLVSEPAEDRDFAAAEGETSQNQTLDAAGSLRDPSMPKLNRARPSQRIVSCPSLIGITGSLERICCLDWTRPPMPFSSSRNHTLPIRTSSNRTINCGSLQGSTRYRGNISRS